MKYKIIYCCPIESISQIKYKGSNFFYFGNSLCPNYKNVFNLDVEDKYENLALKMILGYSQIKNLDFDFILKFDTDTFINFDNIEKMLDNLEPNNNYGFLQEGKTFKKPLLNKKPLVLDSVFPLGGGYILSKQAVQHVCEKKHINAVHEQILQNVCTFEDVTVGHILCKTNLNLINSGYWINKSKGCYSSCFDVFYHSTKVIDENSFKKINLYLKTI